MIYKQSMANGSSNQKNDHAERWDITVAVAVNSTKERGLPLLGLELSKPANYYK
jgi:hypothetical protein